MALGDREWRRWGREHGRHLALGILAFGLIAGLAAAFYVRSTLEAAERRRLNEKAGRIVEAIDKRMSAYEALLLSTRALFAASQEVTHDEFTDFVSNLELPSRYPGILGLGYSVRLRGTPEQRLETIRRVLGESPVPYWPERGEALPESAIVFLEPRTPRNQAAMGFDMYAYPTRREAMDRARDTGGPALSHRVRLIQESFDSNRPGFLFFLPQYRNGVPLDSDRARQEALLGWVYGAFRMDDLIRGILGPEAEEVDFRIFDGPVEDPLQLLFESDTIVARPAIVVRSRLQLAGASWLLVFEGRGPGPIGIWLPGAVLAGFVGLGGLLFAITWLQVRRREAAEDSREELLRNEDERSRLLVQEKMAREEAERARAGARFLADASNLLASELASPSLLEELAERSVPFLGAACSLDLLGADQRLRREVLVSDDPTLRGFLRAIYEDRSLDREIAPTVVEVVETGRAVLRDRPPAHLLEGLPPDVREVARHLGSYLIAPLVARGRTFGAIGFYSRQAARYDETDKALVEDLAQRVALAMDNARLFSNAQEAIRVRDDFLSIASHELRTPLTALQAQLQGLGRQIAKSGPLPPERLQERLDTAVRQTFRLGRLVRDLLDFTLLTEERIPLEVEDFDLAGLVREVADRFRSEATRAGSEIHVDAGEGTWGSWDRQRLDQLIGGLLSNAIKYGAGEPISVTLTTDGPLAILEVRDRGIGIAAEAQARIFDRYERAASLRHYGGLGLGLFIACQIVVAHDGMIEVQSEPGAGATFRASLPLRSDQTRGFRKVSAPREGV